MRMDSTRGTVPRPADVNAARARIGPDVLAEREGPHRLLRFVRTGDRVNDAPALRAADNALLRAHRIRATAQ
jgi:hypothetical protein